MISEKNNRQLWFFDVLKGISCIAVFIGHFWGSYYVEALGTFRGLTGNTILSFFNNGNLSVELFWVISGFLIVYTIVDREGKANLSKTQETIVRRLFSLYLPCAMIVIISWLFKRFGLILTEQAYAVGADEWILTLYNSSTSVDALKDGLKTIWDARATNAFAPQLWTMHYEFFAGTLCLIGLSIFYNKQCLRIVAYIIIIIISKENANLGSSYSACIYAGALSCEVGIIVNNLDKHGFLKRKWNKILLCILSCIVFNYSAVLRLEFGKHFKSGVVMAMAIGITYLALEDVDLPQILKPIVVVGKYSFSIYLVHFLFIVSFGALLFINMKKSGISFFVINVLVMLVTGVVSVIFEKCVIKPINNLFKITYSRIR